MGSAWKKYAVPVAFNRETLTLSRYARWGKDIPEYFMHRVTYDPSGMGIWGFHFFSYPPSPEPDIGMDFYVTEAEMEFASNVVKQKLRLVMESNGLSWSNLRNVSAPLEIVKKYLTDKEIKKIKKTLLEVHKGNALSLSQSSPKGSAKS